jgi:FkbM family methyltransferase
MERMGTNAFAKVVRWLKRKVIWRVIVAVGGNGNYGFKLAEDLHFDYPLGSDIGRELFAGGFEVGEITWVKSVLKPGDIVVDIGANGGIYTSICALLVGDKGHVYAIEPSSRELDLLRHNIAKNGLGNVTIVPAAVSDRVGTMELAISRDGAYNSFRSINRQEQVVDRWETIETIDLDGFIRDRGIDRLDLIKIDVEGAENLALAGSHELLSGGRFPNLKIFFEAGNDNCASFGYTVADLFAKFSQFGWQVEAIANTGETVSLDHFDPADIGKVVYNFVATKTRSSNQ